MSAKRAIAAFAGVALASLCVATAARAADPIWRLEQPLPPAGAPFKVPLGEPGDLSFWAPNRGLLTVNGNDAIARGIFSWDGRSWHQLATVCGGPGDTARIVWAGPTEFWVISVPSAPRGGSGLGLCHFVNGEVVGSYSTRVDSADPFRQMAAGSCNSPSDCWFGGVGGQDALGERIGAFHLHWDGTALTSFYGPQGRGVTDIEAFAGAFYETSLVGRAPENRTDPVELAEPESTPRLIHRIDPGPVFSTNPFTPAPLPGVPDDGTELLGLDGAGFNLWAVGGGAASGPSAPAGDAVARPPLVAHLTGTGFEEVTPDATFSPSTRFTDVAVLPGSDAAWVTAVPFGERRSVNAKATVARIEADGTTTVDRLPAAGAGRGSAARIACPGVNECWMVTRAGWLFHYSDGTELPQDTEPAFQGTIDFRPNESAEQYVSDTPPEDDSNLFEPPPPPPPGPRPPRPKKLLKGVDSKVHGHRLIISFLVARPAKVQLIAKKGKRVVGKTPMRRFNPGRGKLSLKVSPKRWPNKLSFKTRELSEG